MSNEKQPNLHSFTTKLDDYKILGLIFPSIDPAKIGDCYGVFENNRPLRELINQHSEIGDREIGIMILADPTNTNGPKNFLVGGIVTDIDEAPEGACLMDFPGSEFLVVTHDWCASEQELMDSGWIAQTIGYAFELKLPDGYEKYEYPVYYWERWNFHADENQYRFEVWLSIRKI